MSHKSMFSLHGRSGGNPLSVFTDARGLSDSEMQRLAQGTNLQETTFVLPRAASLEAQEGIKVRDIQSQEGNPVRWSPDAGNSNRVPFFPTKTWIG
jgi:trans-2,3-dihydro-3-hydroxyanthranilate isomerase